MNIPLKVTFLGIEPSEAVEGKIRQRAAELDQFSPLLQRCEVWVDAPHGHHRKGYLYNVRIRATVSGEELDIDRQPDEEDVYVAVRDAFDALRRRLEDHLRRWRGKTKRHEAPPQARVERLFPVEGYGFLKTPEGREIYFHRNSVKEGSFDELRPGTAVAYSEEEGAEGPQATVVRLVTTTVPA
ncbi:MAG TPA: HPF/RaiA family ribosome-associated protein [Thermoanaerobaculia bacterium]|nr:HPF/RaiA family ribosome-associated protein [Thermoanaerobaculia bacterium]